MAAAATSTPQEPTGFARWVPSMPSMNLMALNPFASDEGAKQTSDPAKTTDNGGLSASTNRRPILSTTSFAATASPSGNPPSPSRSITSTMFAEPDTRSTSELDFREGSIDERLRSKKSNNKQKTCFSVCHPPPTSTTRQKLHRRTRPLLQLHKLCANARPLPAFEVIPSANFSVHLTRAITKVFKAKHSLCPNDLVVLRAEKYSMEEEDEDKEARAVIGLICKGRKDDAAAAAGKAKMCMASGQEWEAYPLANGGYEFFSTDEHGLGLTSRWVPKKNKDGSKMKDKRFNFSTISPNSRRHPVIAVLSKTSLEINDMYKMPDPSAATPLSTPRHNSQSALAEAMDEETGGNEPCETSGSLREIITITGMWVTFKEDWCPTFKYDDKDKDAAAGLARSASVNNSPSKTGASPLSTPPGSPAQVPLEKRGSIKSIGSSILRRSSLLNKGNRASQVSVPEEDEGGLERADSVKKTGRARGDSTSTVLVHRAASNRRKNNQQATWRPDLLEPQHQLNETSREDLNSTPGPPHAASSFDSPATPTPTARTAAPIPADRATPTPSASAQALRPVSPEKRVSTTTTNTSSSGAPVKSQKSAGAKGGRRKGGGWRRLLCGASHHDV